MAKDITLFRVNKQGKNITLVCEWLKTRNGFKHECSVMDEHGNTIGFGKVTYLNRTWENYGFQMAIRKALADAQFTPAEINLVDHQFMVNRNSIALIS